MFCGERNKRGGMIEKGGGPWQRNAVNEFLLGGLNIQLFPLGKAHKAHTFQFYLM